MLIASHAELEQSGSTIRIVGIARDAGYEVEARAVAVNPRLSWQGTHYRFEELFRLATPRAFRRRLCSRNAATPAVRRDIVTVTGGRSFRTIPMHWAERGASDGPSACATTCRSSC